ncbi:MAG: ROK family protein, partial [Motiliproteus sp.]|nr:ROK family protein [Motiliproteus sp.]
VDLGGTKIEALVLDPQGQELLRRRVATPAGDYQATVNSICELVLGCEQQVQQQCSLGICIPGTLSPDTNKVKNANSTCLIGQPLDQDLQRLLKRNVKIANDADCFTISEATDGAAANSGTVFGVILGTGVGGGIVINGQLLIGPNRIAGEWGHNPMPWRDHSDLPAQPCYCGKSGCIETYLSGPGLCNQYQIHSGGSITDVSALLQASQNGDSIADRCLTDYYRQLAKSLASVINIVDPDIIVLGGGLSNIQQLYQQVPAHWSDYVFSDQVNTQLKPALHGDSSGVRGSAWL